MESNQDEEQNQRRIKKKKNEGRLRDLLDNVKETNIHVIGVPDKKRKKRG